jgi:hypothetical protein
MEAGDAFGVARGCRTGVNRRTHLRRHAGGRDDVLDADRDPFEPRPGTRGAPRVQRARRGERVPAIEPCPCLDAGVGGVDAIEQRLREFRAGKRTAGERVEPLRPA